MNNQEIENLFSLSFKYLNEILKDDRFCIWWIRGIC